MSKYLLTKKQVNEMYNMVADNWRLYRDNKFTMVIFKEGNKTEWKLTMNDDYKTSLKDKILFEMEMENYGIFEWVILKEIGGRKGMSKSEIIDGIQWNVTNNYNKLVS